MKRLILVDACNILHRLPAFKSRLPEGMDSLAAQLLQQIRGLHDLDHWELHVIVDGKGTLLDQQFVDNLRTLSIIYTAAGQSADTVIETWLMRLPAEWDVKVASEDRAVAHSAIAHQAEVLSANALLQWSDRIQNRFSSKNSRINTQIQFGNQLDGLL